MAVLPIRRSEMDSYSFAEEGETRTTTRMKSPGWKESEGEGGGTTVTVRRELVPIMMR